MGLGDRLHTIGEDVNARLDPLMPTDEVTELKLDAIKVQITTAREQLNAQITEVAKDLSDFKRFLTFLVTTIVAPLLLIILGVMIQLLINRGN